jgi:hypothetical protein
MEKLLTVIQKLKNIDINSVLQSIFTDPNFQIWILDVIRWNQLYEQGVTEDNVRIGTYAPYTYELKTAQGVVNSHITLRDTGAFYSSFKMFVNADNVIINADGDKTDPITGEYTNLFEKYGDAGNLLGLTEENWNKMIDELAPKIIEQIWKSILP